MSICSNIIYMLIRKKESEVAQSCPTLCSPMDCSLPGSSVHRIFQARVLEWVAISFSRGSSQPRDRTWVSHIAGRHFTIWATCEALYMSIWFYYYKWGLGALSEKYEECIKYHIEEIPEINWSKLYVIVFWTNVFQ